MHRGACTSVYVRAFIGADSWSPCITATVSVTAALPALQAQRLRFQHMDMADLERQLQASASARMRLIATDGVFSMDGDIAPLKEILALAHKHDAQVFVDDCHGTGVLGATGRGVDEHWGVLGQVDILNSTLGKALGGATGGYTTGRSDVVQLLRQKSRPYLFSNTLAPAVAGASLEVFRLLSASHELRDKLQHNTDRFRKKMVDVGFQLGHGSHPIMVRVCRVQRMLPASPFACRLGHRRCGACSCVPLEASHVAQHDWIESQPVTHRR
jgi:glycine C-acetyltransferase